MGHLCVKSLDLMLGASVAVQSLSCVRLFVTPWSAAHQGFPVLHCLLEFAQIHVHWVMQAKTQKQNGHNERFGGDEYVYYSHCG